jgi:hypothetical protein
MQCAGEGRNGKAGYSPAYHRIWSTSFRNAPDKPKEYFPLTDQVIHDHLTGKLTAGVYPLLADETCWFLAADFDKATWQDDVQAFLRTCAEWKVPAVLELSTHLRRVESARRSGTITFRVEWSHLDFL